MCTTAIGTMNRIHCSTYILLSKKVNCSPAAIARSRFVLPHAYCSLAMASRPGARPSPSPLRKWHVYIARLIKILPANWRLSVCVMYPVLCRNGCGENTLRKNILKHVDEICPLAMVQCRLKNAGCNVKIKRREMDDHCSNVGNHLSMAALTI